MNIEQINSIPISVILDKMGYKPLRETEKQLIFKAPWRDDKKPNLSVSKHLNVWYDHKYKKGGSALLLVRMWHESRGMDASVEAALKWGEDLVGHIPRIATVKDDDDFQQWDESDSTLKFLSAKPIKKNALIKFGESRGIPPSVLKKYLVEVEFLNKKSGFKNYALGMKTENDSYEARHHLFKGCIGARDITIIPGTDKTEVHIFEEFLDFLSIITRREGKPLEGDAMIMHSLNCLDEAASFVKISTYENCYTYMDNDEPGQKATQAWQEFIDIQKRIHTPMNKEYAPYKDVNAHHMATLEL